jgi:hypothetical protein
MAALAVLIVLGIAVIATLHRSPANTGAVMTADSYAPNLPISNITMTEATNGAGGKSIYVDGTIGNTGAKTLTGAVMQLTFATSDGSPAHLETVPLSLIRTREPYVDLQPASAAPVHPGASADFRLIFETVPPSWDVQPPAIKVVHADLK